MAAEMAAKIGDLTLGSRLVQIQKATAVASTTADRKTALTLATSFVQKAVFPASSLPGHEGCRRSDPDPALGPPHGVRPQYTTRCPRMFTDGV